jgi:acyl-CoA synthetase (AMP-forming)/AMP-acid ligase II
LADNSMETTTARSAPTASSSQRPIVNVAQRLGEFACTMPGAIAIAETSRGRKSRIENGAIDSLAQCPAGYRGLSFAGLEADSATIAAGLAELGVEPGMRIALLVRPGIDFVSLVFALLRLGAVQVLIDPGMGLRNVVRALGEVQPDGFISSAPVHIARWFLGGRFSKARFNVSVGRAVWGTTSVDDVRRRGARQSRQPVAQTVADAPAAIIFTSGSTGPAKGVLFRHGNFDRQVTEIRDFYDIRPGEIDVSCFPLFGLFNAAMGVTSVIPKMDVSRPAAVDPRNIVAAVNDWQATQAFGSPAVWNVVGRYCREQQIRLPSLRRVLSAGAPVAAHVLQTMTECIRPDGQMHTPYGATEALPVASTSSSAVLGETFKRTQQGAGVCVGKKFDGIDWRVVRIKDGAIRTIAEAEELERGKIGELIVRGPVVTTEYVTRPEANALAKIQDVDSFWHRMGDVGYLDEHDRFWFCGRMSQRVTVRKAAATSTMFTIPCEAILNRHPDVFRSALVGMGPRGDQQSAIVVEPQPGRMPRGKKQRDKMMAELRTLTHTADHTAQIDQILIRKSLPVDVRHNVKINREQLAVWAAKKLRLRPSQSQASKS